MQDLIELTSAIHYEAYSRQRLHETGIMIDIGSLNESHIWNAHIFFYLLLLFLLKNEILLSEKIKKN